MSPRHFRRRSVSVAASVPLVCLLLAGCLGRIGQPSAGAGKGPVFPDQATAAEEAFRIAEYAPAGTVPWQNVEGGIWVMFSKPVVALGVLDPPASSSEVLTIDPPLAGIYRWYGSRLLSFEPAEALAPATRYVVSVTPSLASLEGEALQGFNAFRFDTPALEMVEIEPSGSDVPPEDCREISVTFGYPVDVKTVSRSLRVQAAGREFPFTAAYARPDQARAEGGERLVDPGERRRLVLSLRRELPWNTDVEVRLLAGARPGPEPGYTGTEADQVLGFHTLEPLALTETQIQDWLPAIGAMLSFNHPLDEQSVPGELRVELPDYSLEGNLEIAGGAIYLSNLPVPFESSFRVRVLGGLRDIYGQRLGAEHPVDLEVGPAPAYALMRAQGFRALEAGYPAVAVVEFQNATSGAWSAGRLPDPLGALPKIAPASYGVEKLPRNTRLFRDVDLAEYLDEQGLGSAFVRWRFTVPSWWSQEPETVNAELRLQVTDLGLTSHIAHNRLTVRAASLATGRPVAGAQVSLGGPGGRRSPQPTGLDGIASFALAPGELARLAGPQADPRALEVSASKGNDRLLFRLGDAPSHDWNVGGLLDAEQPQAVTYLSSDRGIYRPGEELTFYGIDRDLGPAGLREHRGRFQVVLRQGWERDAVRARAAGTLTPSGRFWGRLTLPADLEPDEYSLVYSRGDGEDTGWAPVRLAFFRRVSFAMQVELPEGVHLMGDTLEGRFSGQYLAGGSVSRGKGSYWWARRPVRWSPPDPEGDYAGFAFGAYREYESWGEYYDTDEGYYEELSSGEGPLEGDGSVRARQELSGGKAGRVYEYTLTATVEDVDRQAISRQAAVPVFTSRLLIGARLTRPQSAEEGLYFVGQGEPFRLQACLVDPEGAAYEPPSGTELEGRLLREEWSLVRERGVGGTVDTTWQRREIEEARFRLQPAGRPDGRGRRLAERELTTGQVGAYIVELRGVDREGREALTRLDFYSTGSAEVLWHRYDEERIELVADRGEYAPGQKARLLIKSPLARGSYLLSVEREGILEERLVEMTGTTATVEVDIREEHVPVVYVSLSSGGGRTAPPPEGPDLPDLGKPKGCFGTVALPVRTDGRRIALEIQPAQASFRPGAEAALTVRATLQGRPLAGAEIAVVAADRGVLDLIDFHLPDPLAVFYNPGLYRNGVAHFDSRAMLIDPVLWKARDLPGGDKEGAEAEGLPDLRRDFRATAAFEPSLVTGPDGTVSLRFRLPDQLTTFRVTAVAAKDRFFGLAESEILVQNPINVRAALPRILRVGDRVTAGVVLTNLDPAAQTVGVRLQVQGLTLEGRAERSVTLASGETQEVAFGLRAEQAGRARLEFTMDSPVLRERLEAVLDVQASTLQEAFTVVGQTEAEAREGLTVPANFLGRGEEGLALSLDSTIASSLTEAVRFLSVYPYDCLEQRTSKLFAWLLYDWLLDDPAVVDRELNELARYQSAEGGMSFWAERLRPDYYVSLRTAHLLELARARGRVLPEGLDREGLLDYLREQYGQRRPYLQSYCLYVLSLAGRDVSREARALLDSGEELGVTEWALLGLALSRGGRRDAPGPSAQNAKEAQGLLARIRDSLRVSTRSVSLSGPVPWYGYHGGEVQAKALVLMLYQVLEPRSQIAQALADDLLAASRKGYWGNTSETGWALQAFAAWQESGGEADADFLARVTLAGKELAAEGFRGRSKQPFTRFVDAPALLQAAAGQAGALPLVFRKEGRGRLYYTATLRYALEAAGAAARDEGIGLYTEILDREGKSAGQTLKLGQVYRVRAVVYSSRDRDFLALRLPIPSGAEAIDTSLQTSQIVPEEEGEEGETDLEYWGPVQRVYDDEVRFFFDTFERGKQEVSFLMRTTTPGTFPTPPATAELMYEPEVFGRTAGREWRIAP